MFLLFLLLGSVTGELLECLPSNFSDDPNDAQYEVDLEVENKVGLYAHRLTKDLYIESQFSFYRRYTGQHRAGDTLNMYDMYGSRHHGPDNPPINAVYERCQTSLQKLIGCVKRLNYELHYIHRIPEVRHQWLVCDFLSDAKKMEKLKRMVNERLPKALNEAKYRMKETDTYAARLNEAVKDKVHALLLDLLKEDVEQMHLEFEEWKLDILNRFKKSQALFVQEFLDFIRRLNAGDLTPVPPTEIPPLLPSFYTWDTPWDLFTDDNNGYFSNHPPFPLPVIQPAMFLPEH